MAPPSLNGQVVISSTNKHLDVTSVAGGDETVTLTEQTYADMPAVCAALQTGLQALGGDWAAATCAVDISSNIGKIKIDSAQAVNAVALEWATGANTATTCGGVLGFATAADDTGAYNYTSDYQHMYGWYGDRAVSFYGNDSPKRVGGDIRTVLDGTEDKRVHVAFHHRFEIALEMVDAELMWSADATGSDTNRDLETLWKHGMQGYKIRWREDQDTPGTSTDYYLKGPEEWPTRMRPHHDSNTYNLTMMFRKAE